jgi:PAS domain S-box-containing protein
MAKRNSTIRGKIITLLISVCSVAVLVVGLVADYQNQRLLETKFLEALSMTALDEVSKLNAIAELIGADLKMIEATSGLAGLSTQEVADSLPAQTGKVLEGLVSSGKFINAFLVQVDGTVVYKSGEEGSQELGKPLAEPDEDLLKKGQDTLYFSHLYREGGNYRMMVAKPLRLSDGQLILVLKVDMNDIGKKISQGDTLSNSLEILFGKMVEGRIEYMNQPRFRKDSLRLSFTPGSSNALLMQNALNHETARGKGIDYRNTPVLAAWSYVPKLEWGVVVKVDQEEVIGGALGQRWQLILLSIGLIVMAGLFASVFSNLLVRPLGMLKSVTDLLGQGVLPNQIPTMSNDELGQITEKVNELVSGLRQTATFAQRIGEGDFEARFKPLSEQDTLGLALIQMRDNLKNAANRDDEQNWVITGIAEVGDILRSTNSINELSEWVIAYIVKRIGAIQGAFYIMQNEEDLILRNRYVEMTASYAYNKKKYLKGRFKFAEGLVGQAVAEQDTILRVEIPEDYMTITSGLLGDRKPSCLLIVPLITIVGSEKEVFGVMEFAGFERFTHREVRFVNEASEIIARTVFNIKVNENTRRLLEMSQRQGDELKQQQEILRQNAEEMHATQEELRRTNTELEYQIEEVNNTQKRMQLLLENASEVIVIFEKDARVRYVSPSAEKILSYSAEELISQGMRVGIPPQFEAALNELFDNTLAYPERKHSLELLFNKKEGPSIWVEAVMTNLMEDKAINGIVANIRDITERRRAEQEARRRGQMQALSENSPDLITRFNTSGIVSYINPIIENYTGISKEAFLQKALIDMELSDTIVSQWENILREVVSDNKKVAIEMPFPTQLGQRVMQVNAIPEYNQEQEIESVLVVSHDITDRKQAELEIHSKNKKITESINYAQRIQRSILPNNALIQRIFPQSFILYKPRDVVSGDFPWFMQKGDDYYIAAVDCTGHGVPGALISLIGYFLLNNVVRNFDEPGKILDELDRDVTHTLRQDEVEATTRDGMDIALCRINLKEGILQYAGAHRPLFFMQNNELVEVKGDKFPIGGGQYKDRRQFTTHYLNFAAGDAIYFCSDGYPDQFGGPDNRKLSYKRVRDVITENANASMKEVFAAFDNTFEEWKNDYKQTDDVLLIGIRF